MKLSFKEYIIKYQNIQKEKQLSFSQFNKLISESPQLDPDEGVFADEMLAKEIGLDVLHQYSLSGHMQETKPIENVSDFESKKFNIVMDTKRHEVHIGFIHNGLFNVVGKMVYKESSKPRENSLIVSKIVVHSAHKRLRLASAIYKSLMADGYTLVSDYYQYKGAVNLWKGFYDDENEWKTLIDDTKIKVQVYDIAADKLLAKDVRTLKDEDIWSEDSSKRNIRLVAFI